MEDYWERIMEVKSSTILFYEMFWHSF
jgi:hypothetical protein